MYTSMKLQLVSREEATATAIKFNNRGGTLTVYSGPFAVTSSTTDGSTRAYNFSELLSGLDYMIFAPTDQSGELVSSLSARRQKTQLDGLNRPAPRAQPA